ncbi:MAG: bifunctional riboflavin kinase/FAD synthetase [Coriobacteriia bacterium]|nr:bifunctional riboflavin kinase/FAD synthetase [Coriobacteriia bacterium]
MTRIVTWEPQMTPLDAAAIAIGVFDGVHLGHQALVHHTVEIAHALDASSSVVTFDRDPDRVVSPETAAPQLLDLDDKLAFLSGLGTDTVLVVPFDTRLAAMSPERFLRDVLLDSFIPVATVVGHDFRFGNRAAGDVGTLEAFGAQHSFTVVAHELITVDGEPVTSTRVRAAVAQGDVALAARLLGRPHRLRGRVVHGRGEGASIGIPTANLTVHHESAVPADGVYAGFALVDDERIPAAISVGPPPTFPEANATTEAHLIGWHGDLYGRQLVVEFVHRLRDQRRFASPTDLAEAIQRDIQQVAKVLVSESHQ